MRATPGRIALLRVLDSEPKPLTSAEIAKKLDESHIQNSSLSRSSLFRVLESLVKTGLIHRINLGSPDSSYEIDFGRKHHHHVICTKCGDLEDIEVIKDCPARKIEYLALSKSEKFDSITDHSLEFFGLCKKCA
jgi:Fe2+ or Zn2+ uptake regulation protein